MRPRFSSRRALGVQFDEARENLFVGKSFGPAIGLRHEAIELVVQFPNDQDEALGFDGLFRFVQSFARAKLFEHVVNLREREAGVFGLALLAQRVEFLGASADFGFERVGSVGKGEGVESP